MNQARPLGGTTLAKATTDVRRDLVAAITDHDLDKYSLLESVLEKSSFFELLDSESSKSGKPKSEFRIAVKPNLAMMIRKGDDGTYTDPFLVIHLLRILLLGGYTNLVVVESQNFYGNYHENRSVLQVAARSGYIDECFFLGHEDASTAPIHVRGAGVDATVPLVDLTLDTVMHDFGHPIGAIPVGRAWVEADFRISFAKLKTHFYSHYTLGVKNVYGCLPLQDKINGYHCKNALHTHTARLIDKFPVHFSLVDGYTSADGLMGVKAKGISRKTHTIIGGADIVAVDHFTTSLIGLKPESNHLYRELTRYQPLRDYQVVGNARPLPGWKKVPRLVPAVIRRLEYTPWLLSPMGIAFSGGYDACFPAKKPGSTGEAIFNVLKWPLNRFADYGIVTRKRRMRRFKRAVRRNHDALPTIAGSEYLLSRLLYFGPEDVDRLIALLNDGVTGRVAASGHYLFANGREFRFVSPLSTATEAAVDMVNHLADRKIEKTFLIRELRYLKKLCPEFYRNGARYSYCFSE